MVWVDTWRFPTICYRARLQLCHPPRLRSHGLREGLVRRVVRSTGLHGGSLRCSLPWLQRCDTTNCDYVRRDYQWRRPVGKQSAGGYLSEPGASRDHLDCHNRGLVGTSTWLHCYVARERVLREHVQPCGRLQCRVRAGITTKSATASTDLAAATASGLAVTVTAPAGSSTTPAHLRMRRHSWRIRLVHRKRPAAAGKWRLREPWRRRPTSKTNRIV